MIKNKTLPNAQNPQCQLCKYVMPSETAQTKLRCGLNYFKSSPLMRKFQRMENFPIVKADNACESWELLAS